MPIHHRIAFGVSVLLVVLSLSSGRPVFAEETTIIISQGVDADTLNPLATNVTPTENVQLQMFDTLVRFDRSGKLIPWLASSFTQAKPNVWEFHLRHGVTFWNGDPLTSSDVAFTIAKIKDPKFNSQLTPRVATISEVRTPDPYTVDVITSKPVPLMPGYLWLTMIVDAKYWTEHGDDYMAEHPMGSGPYVFRRWVKNQEIDLDANPHFWGGTPTIDHVVMKPIADSNVRVAALRSGESNLITNVPAERISTIASLKTLKVQSVKSTRILFFAFNTLKTGPQRNVLVRRAINYLVNVPSLLQSV
ncbi:MAG TPA: ABC transporter substrate-binding protein, partial [Candidatus Baltobacteraceae bacterium]|nr:ABC transporter substrate-binding protein [Candidatus Baltobacteraceae bacterium]